MVNSSYARGHNKRPEEITGSSIADLLGEDLFLKNIKPKVDRCLAGETVHYQAWYEYPTVGRKYRDVTYYPSRQPDGNINGILAVIHDLTDLQLAEEQQVLDYERLTTLINASPDIICFKDGDGKWLLANEADLQLFQLAGVDYKNKTDAELAPYSAFYHDAFLGCMVTDEEAWGKGVLSRAEETIPIPDGTNKVFDVVKIPLFHIDGTRKGLVVLGHDITEHLEIENKLRQEIVARQQAAEVMQEKSLELEEANITLRVLLNKQKDMAEEVQQCVLAQLEKAVLPYITLLRQDTSNDKGREYLDIITDHVQAVGAPFIKKLSSANLGLTKKEILVADMVRQGRKTKEIAELLNLKPPSVETYRNRIRKKMHLNKKNIRLYHYLNTTFTSG